MKTLFSKSIITAMGIFAAACLEFQAFGALAGSILPRNVKPLTLWELRDMYEGRTWVWASGGGRFEKDNHRFTAWSSENGKTSYAEGRWSVNSTGTLCFKAVWTAANGSGSANTCFDHVRDRGTVYQRRLPDGEWYVFKNYRPRTSDEYRKLIRNDTVSKHVERIKKSFQNN